MLRRLDCSDVDHNGRVREQTSEDACSSRKQRQIIERNLVQVRYRLPHSIDVLIVDESMEEVIMQL